jgi:hypothetical protein
MWYQYTGQLRISRNKRFLQSLLNDQLLTPHESFNLWVKIRNLYLSNTMQE